MTTCRYTRARNVDEAVAALAEAGGEAHVIAGGVALGILMNERLVDPVWLVDISRIDSLREIDLAADGTLTIGALATHRDVEESDAVFRAIPMLRPMAAEIACGRIKNRGTIGGNICLGDPQGDPPVAAIALDAVFRITGPDGIREVRARDFFLDHYTTALGENEILQSIVFPPLATGTVTEYGKYAARKAMDYTSTVSVAVRVRFGTGGEIADIGLGFGGVGAVPVGAPATEAVLRGRSLSAETHASARAALLGELAPLDDILYSADYKRHVASVILKRTLDRAAARAGGGAARQ